MDRTEIFLVRHAESMPSKEIPEADWPLSPVGVWQAQQLANALKRLKIDAIFSSPYARAQATVAPYAQGVGLSVCVTAALRERKLTEDSRDDWLAILQKSWSDFSFTLPHCESSADCQTIEARPFWSVPMGMPLRCTCTASTMRLASRRGPR
jgi:2,3-bisphosphoglycerate-dependent phosphoglycerate mutase